MILVDAGPLIAIFDRDDQDHRACAAAASTLRSSLVTTWSAFSEAMYVLGRNCGWPGQDALWRMISRETLSLYTIENNLEARVREFMRRYRNLPMDLADATLAVAAESLSVRRIFTLDQHFRTYRLAGGEHFELIELSRKTRR